MQKKRSIRLAWTYFVRAMLLRCPLCGTKPIFLPFWKVRRLRDWFSPLDGCPRCGYPYEREPGYYLMAIWAINYGVGGAFGVALYVIFECFFNWPLEKLLAAVLIPVALFNFFFARHSKSLFLALDLFCDPHEKNGGDDGGNRPNTPPPAGKPPSAARPLPEAAVVTNRVT